MRSRSFSLICAKILITFLYARVSKYSCRKLQKFWSSHSFQSFSYRPGLGSLGRITIEASEAQGPSHRHRIPFCEEQWQWQWLLRSTCHNFTHCSTECLVSQREGRQPGRSTRSRKDTNLFACDFVTCNCCCCCYPPDEDEAGVRCCSGG